MAMNQAKRTAVAALAWSGIVAVGLMACGASGGEGGANVAAAGVAGTAREAGYAGMDAAVGAPAASDLGTADTATGTGNP
jgi:hypothetical protein